MSLELRIRTVFHRKAAPDDTAEPPKASLLVPGEVSNISLHRKYTFTDIVRQVDDSIGSGMPLTIMDDSEVVIQINPHALQTIVVREEI